MTARLRHTDASEFSLSKSLVTNHESRFQEVPQ